MTIGTGRGNITTDTSHDLQYLFLMVSQLSKREAEHHQQVLHAVTSLHKHASDNFVQASTNLSRYMMRPVIPLRRQGNIGDRAQENGNEELRGGAGDSTAQLSNHPRTLLLLWHEYLHGLGNNKAAKDFTREERGGAKQKYSKRKLFWDLMCNLLRAGFTELAAIDKICQVYGTNRSVTYVVTKIRVSR